MRGTWLGALVVLVSSAHWCSAQEPARFSREAIEVLEAVSAGYDVNGRPAQGKPHDAKRLDRLRSAADPRVGAVAFLSLEQARLHARAVNPPPQKTATQRAKERAEESVQKHFEKLEAAVRTENKEVLRAEMLEIAKEVAPKPWDDTYDVINDALGTQLAGLTVNYCLKEAATLLAGPDPAVPGANAEGIVARVETARDRFGAMALTNKTGSALHHCLVVTRMIPDRSAGASFGAMNELLGQLTRGMGVDAVTDDMTKANRARAKIALLEQGVLIYVPEIPPGATVRTNLCPSNWLPIAQEAKLSIWCDELTALDVTADNLDEVRKPRPKAEDLGPLGFPKRDLSPLLGPGGNRATFGRGGPGSSGMVRGGPPSASDLGAGVPKDGGSGRGTPTPPGIVRNPAGSDGVTLKRGGAGGFRGLARGGNNGANAGSGPRATDPPPKRESTPKSTPPRAAGDGPAFKSLKKATFITLLPLEGSERAKGYVFPACVPSGGSYRTNGKEITLDYAPPATLKAVAEGQDAYVAIGQDRTKGQTYLIMVPKERVEGGKN